MMYLLKLITSDNAFHLPPITHKVLLVKDGSVRTQEGIGLTAGAAHVERLEENGILVQIRHNFHIPNLAASIGVGVDAGVVLGGAVGN